MLFSKLIMALLAYGILWDALSRWRVRAPERRLQLQLYGLITGLYVMLVGLTGGLSPGAAAGPLPSGLKQLYDQCIYTYFGAFSSTFLMLGTLEIGISLGFYDPSLPLLGRWWVRAMFEGPVFKLLARRLPGTPLTPDESESSLRHALAGMVTITGSLWGLQIALGLIAWGRWDPVAILLLLKAVNIWLDARLRDKLPSPQAAPIAPTPLRVQACMKQTCRQSGANPNLP